MVQQRLPKSIFLTVALASFVAFLAVNLHAKLSASPRTASQTEMLNQRVEEATEQHNDRDLSIPDVTVLGRLFELAQRFLPRH